MRVFYSFPARLSTPISHVALGLVTRVARNRASRRRVRRLRPASDLIAQPRQIGVGDRQRLQQLVTIEVDHADLHAVA